MRPLNLGICPLHGRTLLGESWLRSGFRFLVSVVSICALGLFLARAPLSMCFAAVVGPIVLVLLSLHPVMALYALAFTIPFGSLYELSLGGFTIGASELLVIALVAAWLMRMMATRRVRVVRPRMAGALFCYLGALAISLLPARNLAPALKELAKWVEFLFVMLFVASDCGPVERQRLVAVLLLAGTLEGMLGIYQFLRRVGPPGFVLFGRYMRAYGTFQQPNPFGGYMGLLLPLAYTTVLGRFRDAKRSWVSGALWPAALWCLALVASAVMLAALVMSWSRGALVGLAAGVVFVGLALGRKAGPALAGVVLLGALLGPSLVQALPPGLVARLTDAAQYVGRRDLTAVEITDENFAVVERAAHWYAAWRMFEQSPWLGVGTGQYATAYPTVALPRWQDPLGHAHNYFLNVLAEGGLLGLAAYLAFVASAVGAAWRVVARERGWPRALALAALGMLGHLLAHSMSDNLYVHEMYLLVAMLLGMMACLAGRRGEADAAILAPARLGG